MATYTLGGIGVQPLTPGTRYLYVTITVEPMRVTMGSAHPSNFYNVGLLRPGDSVGYAEPIPVIGGPQRIDLPSGMIRLGYSIFGSGTVQVDEAASLPTLVYSSVDGTTVSNGTPVTIFFQNVEFPTANDWLTIQPIATGPGTGDRVWGSAGFGYTSSGGNVAGSTPLSDGEWTNSISGATPGTYQARLYRNDTTTLIASGPSFTIG